jgi:sigma-E factor negative regulatory protein RseB
MRRALALLACALCGPLAAAEAPPVVERMIEAARTLNYRGHVVQMEGTQAQTFDLLHRAGNEAGEDRVHSLQGAYWELHRAGSQCRIAFTDVRPAHDEAIVAAAFPSLVPTRLVRLAEFYDFVPVGSGRLAGRAVDFTLARPRDEFRFAHLFATDTDTGLLVKAGLLDHHGQVLRQVFFVDLRLIPILSDIEWRARPATVPARLEWTERRLHPAPATTELPWSIGALPAGFGVSGYGRRRMPGGDQEVEQVTVSDGLVSVSVFIDTQAPANAGLLGARRIATMPVYGAAVAGRHVTVLGAAPFAALRQIAAAVGPAPSSAPAPATLTSTPEPIR